MSYVYKITNTLTNKIYVGKTSLTVLERFDKHSRNAITGDTYLYKSIRKYGISNFIIDLIEECPDHLIDDRECFWIKELNSLIPNGYNMTIGGTGGDTSMSPRFKEAMTRMHSTRSPEEYATRGMSGKYHTVDTKRKQSKVRKQHWDTLSDKERDDRSKKIAGNKNGMHGKIPKNSISVVIDNIKYTSIAAACKATGMSSKTVKKYGVLYNESSNTSNTS